jgi:hypothetical protein
MKALLFSILFVSVSIFVFGKSKLSVSKASYGSIYKLQQISDLQVQKLKQAGLYIPKNKMVINEYDSKSEILIMTKIQYDDSDITDGLYFGEYVSYNVIISNVQDIILFYNSVGKAFSSECLVDLKKGIKISFDYSSMRGGLSSFSYNYLNDKKLEDKLLLNQLKNKHGIYFNGNKFWDLISRFDKRKY